MDPVPMTMTSDTPLPLEEIFHAALELKTPAERAAYLDRACADDAALRAKAEALIEAHSSTDEFLEQPIVRPAEVLDAGPGDRIGPYKLLQQIGEGGMGVVFMAEQEQPVRRKVALKIIKLGMDTKQVIARFEAERQALAMMEHQNIARVLDAGATESGRPYFVMELVRGVAINEYCDKHQLSTRERLALIVDTCRAVQHAHQKGVIHRDLKPGNVLVTSHDGSPVVKIIDFGVAKATNQKLTEKTLFTEFRQFIGTPEYMSPEQAEMSGLDVDTRTDIYALGVLTYQLLTGSTPFDPTTLRNAEYSEMTRMIREDEPPTPSTRLAKLGPSLAKFARSRASEPNALVKLLRGDLDWIVMKAISKDRTRRYDSASALAEDVGRHLRNEPVLASPPSKIYKTRKLFQRNRGLILAGSVAVLGVLIGLGVALSGYFTAKAEAQRSNRISGALTDILAVAGTAEALDLEVREVLDTTREVFGDDHTTVAATLSALAVQLRNAGDTRGAESLFAEALEIYSAAYGKDHRSVGQTLASLGAIQRLNGDDDAAEVSLRESLRIAAAQPGPASLSSSATRRELASLLSASGRAEEAEDLWKEALRILRAAETPQHYEIMGIAEERLHNALADPRQTDMDPLFLEFQEAATAAFPTGHRVPTLAKVGRGAYLARQGRNDEAEVVLAEAVAELQAMSDPPGVYLFTALDQLFQVTRFRKDPEGQRVADDALAQFLEVAHHVWAPDEKAFAVNLEYAAERFFDHERWVYSLSSAQKMFRFVKRNRSDATLREIARQMSRIMLRVAEQEPPPREALELALEILDEFPTDGDLEHWTPAMRLALRHRLGLVADAPAELAAIGEGLDSSDSETLTLLESVEALVHRGP